MAKTPGAVSLDDAQDPLVLALDIGSTASRGCVFDASARPVAGGRHKVPHAFRVGGDGTSEIDPDGVVAEVRQILDVLATDRVARRVAGVALDTFASSLVGVGADGRALTPCYTYADARCGEQVVALRRELDERAVQQRTGCRIHASYLAPRLRWLRETDPSTVAEVASWLSLGEYVQLQVLGVSAAGTSTAAWTGMLDRRTGRWDDELLAAVGVRAEQLSEVRDPDQPLTEVGSAVAQQWPALAGAVWFPPISDGLASNLGAGADEETTVALAAATSGAMRVLVPGAPADLPPGLWGYRVDRNRSLLGGAVNDVGRVVSWLGATVRLEPDDDVNALLAGHPDPTVPLVLPYLTGERSTGWAASARAHLAGVSVATTGGQLVRGAMEGVAISYARIAAQLAAVAGPPQRIVASGRVTQDVPALLALLADVLQASVVPVTAKRTTLRGTALLALESLAPEVPRAPVATAPVLVPAEERATYYRERAEAYEQLYRAVVTGG